MQIKTAVNFPDGIFVIYVIYLYCICVFFAMTDFKRLFLKAF